MRAGWPALHEQLAATTATSAGPGEDDGTTVPMIAALVDADLQPWQAIPAPDGAHPMVCDIAWFADAAWVSFGNKTISTDGAQVYSWKPGRGWKLELDWDRGGAPGITHEQGGQGISRLRVIDDLLYATDADAPNFGGFGISGAPFEGYVFVANREGFGPLSADQQPPAETLIVPLAFHVFDITRFRGHLVASGGTISPPGSRSRYPGGLFIDAEPGQLWPRFFPGKDSKSGVVRATFMHRFRNRLYVGFQNNERRMGWDLGVIEGDPALADTQLILGRVTEMGGWKTRHFASDEDQLYWIASDHRNQGRGALFQSRDGLHFTRVELGPEVGEPHDVPAAGGQALLLTDTGLYRLQPDGFTGRILAAPKGNPFARRDGFCSATMAATPLGLMAASTNGLGLFLSKPSH